MNINILLAFNSNQIENFLDNFRFDETDPDAPVRVRTDFAEFTDDAGNTLNPYNRDHLAVYVDAAKYWKEKVVGGPILTRLATIYIPDIVNAAGKLSMIEYLRSHFDGRFTPIGVWYTDAAHTTTDGEAIEHGQTITRATYNENGGEITPEGINGTGTYPLIPEAAYLDYMPDDVTYDQNGGETSRVNATAFKQVHLLQGQKHRRI